MNSTYNVTTSTLRIMSDEFKRGSEICEVWYEDLKKCFLLANHMNILNQFF
jgi:poly(A) polymerase Pap1